MGMDKITIGSKVLVAYSNNVQTNDPARKYDGEEFVVKQKRTVLVGKITKWYWELYGAESKYGVPYGFCEEDLIKI